MPDLSLLNDHDECSMAGEPTFERRNPVTGEVASHAPAATVADAVRTAETAAAAFESWQETSPAERRRLLQAAAAEFLAAADEFAEVVTAETGAAARWGHFNVGFAVSLLEEAAAITTQIAGQVIPSNHPGTMALALRGPAGVVLGIAPWNAPVILAVRAIAVPLACGNTVILKGSEICPATHRLVAEMFVRAGFPDGVVNVITHAPADASAVVEAMIAHPAIRRVNFTGSSRVGRLIGELCGRHLKPVLLELGGKAPLVVLDDADLDNAVNAATFGAFTHQGQICMSTERLIVDGAVADAFVAKLKSKVSVLRFGTPAEGFPIAACVDKSTPERVRALIDDALAKGAELVCGGTGDGVVFAPTVVDRVTHEMRLYREESFGPIVAVIRVDGDASAVCIANDSDYGLSAAVHSRDVGRAMAVAKRIDSGICHINGPTVQDEAQMPFGGTKASGYGRFGGQAGIDAFTEVRWITIDTEPRHYPS